MYLHTLGNSTAIIRLFNEPRVHRWRLVAIVYLLTADKKYINTNCHLDNMIPEIMLQ